MAPLEELHQAQVNRSIRTIKAELEYLCDSSVISPSTLSDLLSRIPPQTALHAPLSVGAVPPATQNAGTAVSPPPSNPIPAPLNLPNRSTSSNEKQNGAYFQPSASPQPQQQHQEPPPPAYNAPPPQANWPPLAQATALYAYTSTDAGDLELEQVSPSMLSLPKLLWVVCLVGSHVSTPDAAVVCFPIETPDDSTS